MIALILVPIGFLDHRLKFGDRLRTWYFKMQPEKLAGLHSKQFPVIPVIYLVLKEKYKTNNYTSDKTQTKIKKK